MKENQRVTITKKMLKEGLLRLLKNKNLNQIRVNELCVESGINRTTFYRHYETPQDVLLELETEFIKQATSLIKYPQNVNEARKMLEYTCTYVYEHTDIAKILFQCNTEEDMMRRFKEFYHHFIELHKTEIQLASMDEATVKIVISFMGGGGYYLLRQWILEDIPKTPQEVADILYNLIYLSSPTDFWNSLK